jgi:hypothetical protein
VGDSFDNALAETVIGLFKTEVIYRRGPWRSFDAVEYATLEWVDWFNNRRLLEPIGNIPPAEAEANYYLRSPGWPRSSAAIAPATAQFPPPPAPATPMAPVEAPPATTPTKPAVSPKKKAPTPRGPSITGKWSGKLTQVDNPTPYKFELAIGPKGAETKYPDFDCTGKLTRVGSSKSYVFFVEIITKGRAEKGGRCPDGTVTVARQGDELAVAWFGSIEGKTIVAYGTLSKH